MTRATINYAARTGVRQRYYANDHSRDTVVIDGQALVMTTSSAKRAPSAAATAVVNPAASLV